MPVDALESYIIIQVDEVDLDKRLAHCVDKTNSNLQCSFRSNGAGLFYVPRQGERWVAVRIGHVWYLQQRLDTADDQAWVEANMQPGDLRLAGVRTWLEGDLAVGSSAGAKIGTTGGSAGQKLGFYGHVPVVQPLLATGAGHTVDDLITVLQLLGLARQT